MEPNKQLIQPQEEWEENQPEKTKLIKGEKDLDDWIHSTGVEAVKPEAEQDSDDRVHQRTDASASHSEMEDPDDRVHQ